MKEGTICEAYFKLETKSTAPESVGRWEAWEDRFPNEEAAIRQFQQEANDPRNRQCMAGREWRVVKVYRVTRVRVVAEGKA